MSIFGGKWLLQKAISIILVFTSSLFSVQDQTQSNNKYKEQVIIEEKWKGYNWSIDSRRTLTYDSHGNCISELIEKWNGNGWVREMMVKSTYDGLHQQVSSCKYKPKNNSSGWDLIEGYRSKIDTTIGKSKRVVFYNAEWDQVNKTWIASDKIYYDNKGRIAKSVCREISYSDTSNDSIIFIETSENNYLNDNSWVEISNKLRSDKLKGESERFRYRQISDSGEKVYAVDVWDNEMNRWITNTARLFRKNTGNLIEIDSIEEIIGEKSIPVYVSAETRDSSGNILQYRVWQKNYNEEKKKWTGKYEKWDRVYNAVINNYTVAESVFVADSVGLNWKLIRYENKICKVPSAGDITESGYYEALINDWQYEKSFDTLASFGVFINGECFYDEVNKKWLPTLKCNISKDADSTKIITERLDMQNNEWKNDSLFVVRTDSQGKIMSRINYVWARTGMFNENWSKVSRITYTR